MRDLRDLTNETITLQIRDGAERSVQIERMDSQQAVRTFIKLGSSWQLPSTSAGMAMMAQLPDEEVELLLATPIVRLTRKPTSILSQSAVGSRKFASSATRSTSTRIGWASARSVPQ